MNLRRMLALVLALVAAAGVRVDAATQALSLQAGWNLVSFAVTPNNPAPSALLAPLGTNFQALWGYDAATRIWRAFPETAQGVPVISAVATGRGYWLKVNAAQVLVVNGPDTPPPATPDLAPAWNLVGFTLDEPVHYDRVLNHRAIRQIWTFNEQVRVFEGVELDPFGVPVRPSSFIELRPGKGYWVLAEGESVPMAPVLASALPPDRDTAPFVPGISTDERTEWLERNPGDVDIGGDGFYDRSKSQRAMDLGDNLEFDTLSVFNSGAGILRWRVEVLNSASTPWLRLRVTDPISGEQRLVTETSGSVATETDVIDVFADRTGYGPGDYSGRLRITSNGANRAAPEEPVREIAVLMGVADLHGDYRLRADLETADGKAVDLPQPRLSFSVYRDTAGLKAIVDPVTTLLVSNPVRLVGDIYQPGTTRFALSGSFEMPATDPANPFKAVGAAVRRDITIIGARRESLDEPIGPADLTGQYRETLRFLGEQGQVVRPPIYLAGKFTAQRTSRRPSTLDVKQQRGPGPGDVPDGTSFFEQNINITERQILTDVDVTVDIVHGRPADLVVSVQGPDCHLPSPVQCRKRILRNLSAQPRLTGAIVYDDGATPFESLDVYRGMMSVGRWTLRVEDRVPTEGGTVRDWSIRLRGTKVASVRGTVAGVGAGAQVILSGCGKLLTATTAANGSYRFDDLVDCLYRVTVLHSGFRRTSRDVVLGGVDATGVDLAPATAPADVPIPVTLPAGPNAMFRTLTTTSGAGLWAECVQDDLPTDPDRCDVPLLPVQAGRLRYAFDAATFDLDRPPLAGAVGNEDSNLFVGVPDPLDPFGTNQLGGNDRIDGPLGAARRAFVAIGMPIFGPSSSTDRQLLAGPNP
jgi:subtilisin-like proprotein convertase family protein